MNQARSRVELIPIHIIDPPCAISCAGLCTVYESLCDGENNVPEISSRSERKKAALAQTKASAQFDFQPSGVVLLGESRKVYVARSHGHTGPCGFDCPRSLTSLGQWPQETKDRKDVPRWVIEAKPSGPEITVSLPKKLSKPALPYIG